MRGTLAVKSLKGKIFHEAATCLLQLKIQND